MQRRPVPKRLPIMLVAVLLMAALLAGCGGSSAPSSTELAPGMTINTSADRSSESMAAAPPSAPEAASNPANAEPQSESAGQSSGEQIAQATPLPNGAAITSDPNRKIIKNADLTVEAENVDFTLSRIGTAAAQVGGYVLETRTDFPQANRKSALLKIAVPVDQFEATLERIRNSAKNVLSEQATGVDASQEYVDVQSQIANLEATQARIREFLAQATTVEESLKVNAQLSEIEGQISTLKGRLSFLSQRAAYSTISVQIQQIPPPEPVATPVPTPEPTFNPNRTADQAFGALTVIVQAVVTVGIWVVVFILPLLLPLALIALIIRILRRRAQPPVEAQGGSTGD